ncbi:PaaI family thioesterase [Belnapia sp. T6]|uniref:PaaI family thioesterase n=1 Tax=Belnapia mucosa TaxID=2804532 RepID=A0ABS1V8G8_9PROT|nr:PaaI family thioesterase [Belnapia mucosa]MBL6457963.1 PaaI family thioesterase [Belnapia mucosa]
MALTHPSIPDDVPEGFVLATHGGAYAQELGPFWSKRGEAEVSLGLRLQPRHCNSVGAAHGGFLATLADLGLIHAAAVMRERAGWPRHQLTTVNLALDYLAPAREGCWLEIRAEVTRLGRNLCFTEGALLADGRRVARASGVMAVLGPRD